MYVISINDTEDQDDEIFKMMLFSETLTMNVLAYFGLNRLIDSGSSRSSFSASKEPCT